MTFTKQAPFSKKTTDLPDIPSPIYTAAQIKEYIQNPSDELMTSLNNLVDALNGTGWLDRPKIKAGAVGTTELDPAILAQPQTTTEVQAKLQQHDEQFANIAKDIGLKSDGTDQSTTINNFITNLNGAKATVIIANGTFDISTNLTIPSNVDLLFRKGGLLRINTGATLAIKGTVLAGNQEIFIDAGGTVSFDQSPNEYNLGWFQTTNGYINERWVFAKKGMSSYHKKSVRVPKPYDGQLGTLNSGGRMFWLFGDEIRIMDPQNTCVWYIDGEFKANNNCNNLFNFQDTSKPENIYFYGDINILVDPAVTVGCGINIQSGSRITFWGNVVINGCQTPIKIGSTTATNAVTDIVFFKLQLSYFYQTAVNIYGNATYITENITIDTITATAAQVTGLNAVEIRGLIRDVNIRDVIYYTDVAKNGYITNDAANVVYIESNDNGILSHVRIDSIYQANASNGLKTNNVSATLTANNLLDVSVKNIYGKYNGDAAILDYCQRLTIDNIENNSNVTVNNTCYYVVIRSGAGLKTITDNGNYSVINGLGKQSRGTGVAPAPTVLWPIGSFIRETSDGKVYLRISNTGTASDFVALN